MRLAAKKPLIMRVSLDKAGIHRELMTSIKFPAGT
jgi:hypothetical protein